MKCWVDGLGLGDLVYVGLRVSYIFDFSYALTLDYDIFHILIK